MSSERKLRSAGANGAKAQGAKTPEGIMRSAGNAPPHGLTCSNIVVANESAAQFQMLRESCLREVAPQMPLEADLFEELVAARWRLARVRSLEAGLLDLDRRSESGRTSRPSTARRASRSLSAPFTTSLAPSACSIVTKPASTASASASSNPSASCAKAGAPKTKNCKTTLIPKTDTRIKRYRAACKACATGGKTRVRLPLPGESNLSPRLLDDR
jgi:hypothetical protein